jgi:hypothetical protein
MKFMLLLLLSIMFLLLKILLPFIMRSWIEELIKNTVTSNDHSTLDINEEDHDVDGIVLFFCFLQEFSGATREALILAKEALHPM